MSVQSVALASLAVTYSDSEGEEDIDVDDEANTLPSQAAAPHNNQVGQPQGIVSPIFAKSATNSPTIPPIPQTNNLNISIVNVTPKKVQQLVSYHDHDDSFVHHEEVTVIPDGIDPSTEEKSQELPPDELILDDLIPPEPEGQCPLELQEKISALHRKMLTDGLDLNRVIQQRKDFKNPSIYSKLISFCRINELGTNYSPQHFDPFKWGEESYYEELAKTQEITMERLAKKSKAKVDMTTGTAKRPTVAAAIDESKRKIGKWDQVTTVAAAAAPTKTTVITSTAASDKKCKVIVAFGAVQKRRL